MSPSLQTMGFFMSDINFCNTKEQLNHLGEVVTGKVDGSPTGADIDTSTLPYTGQVRKTLPALEEEYQADIDNFVQVSDQLIVDKTAEFDASIANKEAEADAAIDSYRLLNKGPYASGITLESKFEYITYNGESYFATNPPYTTTATTPDADVNLFVGGYVNETLATQIAENVLEENISTYTDIVYKASGGNSAVENMIAGVPLVAKVGDSCLCENGSLFVRMGEAGDVIDFFASGKTYAADFGVTGDNQSEPYTQAFLDVLAYSGLKNCQELVFPDREIYHDLDGPSFLSNCKYSGFEGTIITHNDPSKRLFNTIGQENFSISGIKFHSTEVTGSENNFTGGGYVRFESCNNFSLSNFEASKSFGTGIRFILCTDFKAYDFKTEYNQFTGFDCNGCSDYEIYSFKSNKNGRYSANDEYKPLPDGWVGTHGGRGYNISANGDNNDQNGAVVHDGQCVLNSEYGGRCFASDTKGIKNFTQRGIKYEDNGAPAGTYGNIVLTSDKGVDLLINSDPSEDSENITSKDINIVRSLGYGTAFSVNGNTHKSRDIDIKLTGAAVGVVNAYFVFGGSGYSQERCRSSGSNAHLTFGSSNPRDVTIKNDLGDNCLVAIQGEPSSGANILKNSEYYHTDSPATSGQDGLTINSAYWDISGVILNGFYRQINVVSLAPSGKITQVTTTNSVDRGIRAPTNMDQSGFYIYDNAFDSFIPVPLGTFTTNLPNGFSRRSFMSNSMPSNSSNGGDLNWNVGDMIVNTNVSIGNPVGWHCTSSGTPGIWTASFILT